MEFGGSNKSLTQCKIFRKTQKTEIPEKDWESLGTLKNFCECCEEKINKQLINLQLYSANPSKGCASHVFPFQRNISSRVSWVYLQFSKNPAINSFLLDFNWYSVCWRNLLRYRKFQMLGPVNGLFGVCWNILELIFLKNLSLKVCHQTSPDIYTTGSSNKRAWGIYHLLALANIFLCTVLFCGTWNMNIKHVVW